MNKLALWGSLLVLSMATAAAAQSPRPFMQAHPDNGNLSDLEGNDAGNRGPKPLGTDWGNANKEDLGTDWGNSGQQVGTDWGNGVPVPAIICLKYDGNITEIIKKKQWDAIQSIQLKRIWDRERNRKVGQKPVDMMRGSDRSKRATKDRISQTANYQRWKAGHGYGAVFDDLAKLSEDVGAGLDDAIRLTLVSDRFPKLQPQRIDNAPGYCYDVVIAQWYPNDRSIAINSLLTTHADPANYHMLLWEVAIHQTYPSSLEQEWDEEYFLPFQPEVSKHWASNGHRSLELVEEVEERRKDAVELYAERGIDIDDHDNLAMVGIDDSPREWREFDRLASVLQSNCDIHICRVETDSYASYCVLPKNTEIAADEEGRLSLKEESRRWYFPLSKRSDLQPLETAELAPLIRTDDGITYIANGDVDRCDVEWGQPPRREIY